MANPSKKSKSPILLFIGFFVVIVVLMFISRFRFNDKYELNGPAEGIIKLYTVGNYLAAISPTGEFCLWDWDKLDQPPKKGSVKAEKLLCLNNERIIWIPSDDSSTVVVSNLTSDKTYKKLSLGYDKQCKYMEISGNGRFIVFALTDKANADHPKKMQLEVLDVNSYELSNVSEIDLNNAAIRVNNVTISDDGAHVAVAGQKEETGWIAFINIKKEETIWQKNINETIELTEIIFSSKGDVIYTAGVGRNIYVFKVGDGDLVNQFQVDENIVAQKRQNISTIAVTDNGHLLGASTEPSGTVYIWNLVTGKRVYTDNPGMTITSGLAFSPDSSLFAVSDIQINPVKIFKCP
jgi:WD40 repeat protein